jgi:hypothetical protein
MRKLSEGAPTPIESVPSIGDASDGWAELEQWKASCMEDMSQTEKSIEKSQGAKLDVLNNSLTEADAEYGLIYTGVDGNQAITADGQLLNTPGEIAAYKKDQDDHAFDEYTPQSVESGAEEVQEIYQSNGSTELTLADHGPMASDGDGGGNRVRTTPLGSGDVLTGSLTATSAIGLGLEKVGGRMTDAGVGLKVATAGKSLGALSTVASGALLVNDGIQYNNGSMTGARFSYHLGSFVAEVTTGFMFGGGYGAIIGGSAWGLEKAYDGLMWYAGELSRYTTNFSNNAWKLGNR